MRSIIIGLILLVAIALLSQTISAQSLDQIQWTLTVNSAETNHISMTLSGYNPNPFTWTHGFPNAAWAFYSIDGDVQSYMVPPMSISITIQAGETLTEPMDHYAYVPPGIHSLQAHALTAAGYVPLGIPVEVNIEPVSNVDGTALPLLMTVYPNPCHGSLSITGQAIKSGTARISVFNLKGQKIRDLDVMRPSDGSFTVVWDGKDMNSKPVQSGVYIIRKIHEGGSETRRVTLIR